MKINNNLKKYRTPKGLTQLKLSIHIGITERQYRRYEKGKQSPNVYTAIRLSRALGTTVEELFPLSDQTNENSKIL